MVGAAGSSARMASPMARTVPELPALVSQPRRRNAACTGSSSRRAARRARSKRLAEILPSRKKRSLKETQPICRLSSSRGFSPSPMISSVLPPPMSTTRRLPGSFGMVCATPAVDEARLFHAGDDFDRMAERLAGALEERLLLVRQPQRVGAHHAHAVGVHVAQALAEALQAGERTCRHVLVDAAVLGDAGGQAHHLAQAVDDDQLAVRVARDHHVEAVGA